jgi:hypothetical protein
MFSFSLFTLFLVSLQRGLALIFYNPGHQIIDDYDNIRTQTTSAKMLRLILKTLGKTVIKHKKGVFKCIWVVYKFSTMLLKRGCNTVDKVQVWTKSTCGKLLLMPWRIGVEKHHSCSDLREQSITLSPLNVNTLIYIL